MGSRGLSALQVRDGSCRLRRRHPAQLPTSLDRRGGNSRTGDVIGTQRHRGFSRVHRYATHSGLDCVLPPSGCFGASVLGPRIGKRGRVVDGDMSPGSDISRGRVRGMVPGRRTSRRGLRARPQVMPRCDFGSGSWMTMSSTRCGRQQIASCNTQFSATILSFRAALREMAHPVSMQSAAWSGLINVA